MTTGTDWKFLKLTQHLAYIDRSDYFISEVDKILEILTATFQPKPLSAND